MKPPEFVTATPAQLEELLALAEASFPPPQYQLLKGVLDTFAYVMQALQNAKTSLRRFRHMLFGGSSEKRKKVFKDAPASAADKHPPATATDTDGARGTFTMNEIEAGYLGLLSWYSANFGGSCTETGSQAWLTR